MKYIFVIALVFAVSGCSTTKDEMTIAAEAGDYIAQYQLAVKYANGDGLKKDSAEAVKWYRKAAEQGLVQAQYNLAYMLLSGEGVAKDMAEAYS